MSHDTEAASTTIPEPTDARFSMRALLMVMAVVAVVAALVGPLVRRLDSGAQFRLLTTWSIWLTLSILWIGYLARRRARVENMSGRTLLALPMFDERVSVNSPTRRWVNVVAALFLCLLGLAPLSGAAIDLPRRGSPTALWWLGFLAAMGIFWIGRAVAIVWWRRRIRLCEAGLLWDHKLVRWDHLLEYSWNQYDAGIMVVRGIDQNGVEVVWRVPVPGDKVGDVQALFDGKATLPSIPPGLPISHLSSIPISIAVRDSNFFKLIGRLIVVTALLVGYFSLRGAAPVSGEFSFAILLGIFGVALVPMRSQSGIRQSGSPLVRLQLRRRWLALASFCAAAAGCYYVGFAYGWMSERLDYAAGAGFGGFAAMAIRNAWPGQIDLRENGVVRSGRFYWPWDEVRVVTWDNKLRGGLVLQHRWQRIIAVVPPEQREAVDRVLQEKSANSGPTSPA